MQHMVAFAQVLLVARVDRKASLVEASDAFGAGDEAMWRHFGRNVSALVIAGAAFLLLPGSARASSDIGCEASWTLRHDQQTGCDDMVTLIPGNDTRVNLLLLLGRAQPTPAPPPPVLPAPDASSDTTKPGPARADPVFDWATYQAWTYPKPAAVGDDSYAAGEGSRCLSDKVGAAAFAQALSRARQVTTDERAVLVTTRQGLKPTCTDAGGGAGAVPAAVAQMRSPAGKAFGAYLEGVAAFYAGDFDLASARFLALARSDDEWLCETSSYMLGRVEVNRAQVGVFDEYGYRDDKHPIDQRAVAAAESGLFAYLRAYPQGRYAGSARGLLRRVYWFGGDNRKLAALYAALITEPRRTRELDIDDPALAEEIDNKLLAKATVADTSDPTLLAVLDLRAMRNADGAPATLTRAALETQRPVFAHDPALFALLLATHAFYVEGDPREVLVLIPDASRGAAYDGVQFSGQVLRGMALDVIEDRGARGFWLALFPGARTPHQRATVELAFALHEERAGGLDRVFAPDTPVRNAMIRDILLTNVADAALLRRQVADAAAGEHERAMALFTLLYKDLTQGGYRDFTSDVLQVPAGAKAKEIYFPGVMGSGDVPTGIFTKGRTMEDFTCPALHVTAAGLAAAPREAKGLLCLGDFIRLNDLDGFVFDTHPKPEELGGTKPRFAGTPTFSRLEAYKAIIADRGASADNRAYALLRAVNCYGPSGNNECGGVDVAPAVRKGWFQQLHRDYPTSRWAQAAEYYW